MKRSKHTMLVTISIALCLVAVLLWWLQDRFNVPRVGNEVFGKVIVSAWAGRCSGIDDGDSIFVQKPNGEHIAIRLAGIDAPQRRQAWARRATDSLIDAVLSKPVTVLEIGERLNGQTVGFVIVDGKNINAAMLEQGAAWFDENHSTSNELKAIEHYAREEKRGLWSERIKPQAPWEFPFWGKD